MDVGAAAQGHAAEGARCEFHFAAEFLVGQLAADGYRAVDVAFGELPVDTGGVERLAGHVELEAAVAEQLQRTGCGQFAAVVGPDAQFVQRQRFLAEPAVAADGGQAVGFGVTAVELPADFGRTGFAFDVDAAVQTACNLLSDRIVGAEVFHRQRQIQFVGGGIDAAVDGNGTLLQQLDGGVFHADQAVAVDGEVAQYRAHGNAVFIGISGGFVGQVDGAVQCDAV